jgi:hypothetical protein
MTRAGFSSKAEVIRGRMGLIAMKLASLALGPYPATEQASFTIRM